MSRTSRRLAVCVLLLIFASAAALPAHAAEGSTPLATIGDQLAAWVHSLLFRPAASPATPAPPRGARPAKGAPRSLVLECQDPPPPCNPAADPNGCPC
jgi:hypothetical protein